MENIRNDVHFLVFLKKLGEKAEKLLASHREQRRLRKATIALRYCSEHIKKDIGWLD